MNADTAAERWLGRFLPDAFVLARSPTIVVAVNGLCAYPVGFSFCVHLLPGPGGLSLPADALGMTRENVPPARRDWFVFDDPAVAFRLGVELDGVALRMVGDLPLPKAGEPALVRGSGNGGNHGAHTTYWVTSLPRDGVVTFTCEWIARDIPLARHEIAAEPIRRAGLAAPEL